MVLLECPQQLKHWPRLALPLGSLTVAPLPLTAAQLHYLVRVRRLKLGDSFLVFDGSGALAEASLVTPEQAILKQFLQPQVRELGCPVHLAIAMPKGNGLDDLIRPLTELGVASITPLLTTYSQTARTRLERWQTIAQEAAEQSERLVIPSLQPPQAWADWLARQQQPWFLAAARAEAPHLLTAIPQVHATAYTIAIGPEGGWSEAEIESALAQQAILVNLGRRVLRTLTAPLAAASLLAGYQESREPSPHG